DFGLEHLLAAEGQKLTGERSGVLSRFDDFSDIVVQGARWFKPRLDQLTVADDGRQQIVKIVRDAAGEPADGLHLLRLHELLFKLFALSNVIRRGEDTLLVIEGDDFRRGQGNAHLTALDAALDFDIAYRALLVKNLPEAIPLAGL